MAPRSESVRIMRAASVDRRRHASLTPVEFRVDGEQKKIAFAKAGTKKSRFSSHRIHRRSSGKNGSACCQNPDARPVHEVCLASRDDAVASCVFARVWRRRQRPQRHKIRSTRERFRMPFRHAGCSAHWANLALVERTHDAYIHRRSGKSSRRAKRERGRSKHGRIHRVEDDKYATFVF